MFLTYSLLTDCFAAPTDNSLPALPIHSPKFVSKPPISNKPTRTSEVDGQGHAMVVPGGVQNLKSMFNQKPAIPMKPKPGPGVEGQNLAAKLEPVLPVITSLTPPRAQTPGEFSPLSPIRRVFQTAVSHTAFAGISSEITASSARI